MNLLEQQLLNKVMNLHPKAEPNSDSWKNSFDYNWPGQQLLLWFKLGDKIKVETI